MSTSTKATIPTWNLTKVFQGNPDNVAWMVDIKLDQNDRPYVLFSYQIDGRGLPPVRVERTCVTITRWDGSAWHSEEIAHPGRRLYPGEDDFSGLGALDPNNADVGYISTDADPVSGAPLISEADHQRHYGLVRSVRDARSSKWIWTPFP